MKRIFLVWMTAVVLLLSACGAKTAEQGIPEGEEGAETLSLRIAGGADTGELLLAGETANDLYVQSAEGVKIYLDGKPAEADDLKNGMKAELTYDGTVEETYPAHLGGVKTLSVFSEESNDICGLYLDVLQKLWETDEGLNENINYISADLSEAAGLTEGEKAAVLYRFSMNRQTEVLSLSYHELAEQGYLTELAESGETPMYQWADGVLFSISDKGSTEQTLHFDAQKWRSPLGADYFTDCKADLPVKEGEERFTIGSMGIS